MNSETTVKLSEIEIESTFKIGRFEFVKMTEENGVVIAQMKDCLFNSRFGRNNDFSKSDILERLTKEILPEIEQIVGSENVTEFETDLLSLDGSAKYGVVKSKISLPTFDFYRKHRRVYEKYKEDYWWWLATPDSTDEWNTSNFCVCVSPSGVVCNNYCNDDVNGVRPVLHFLSSIFVSCEE